VFEHEGQMKPILRAWLERQGLAVKEEFPSHVGIADVVGCHIRPEAVAARIRSKQRGVIGPLLRVHIWEHIPNETERRGASLANLCDLFAGVITEGDLQREVACLEARSFVRRTRTGTLRKLNGWHPMHSRLVAVELKLKDWRGACRQAVRYLAYADEAYVALPERTAAAAFDALGCRGLARMRVGLIAVAHGSAPVVLAQSRGRRKATRAQRAPQTHAVERFCRDAIKGSVA